MQFDHYSIRLLTSEDLLPFFQLIDRNRKRLEDFFSGTVARTLTFETTQEYVKEIVTKAEQKTYFPFLIIDGSNGQLAGFIDIKNIDWRIPRGELGCFMDEAYAGKGISAKALSIFTDHCFSEMGFNKLFLRTHESNASARRVAEKCGFEIEGMIRNDHKTTAGKIVDLVYYGKIPGYRSN